MPNSPSSSPKHNRAHSTDFPPCDINQVVIVDNDPNYSAMVQALQQRWGFSVIHANAHDTKLAHRQNSNAKQSMQINPNISQPLWYLTYSQQGLRLHCRDVNCRPLHIDFLNGKNTYRHQHSSSKHELIARAIGAKPHLQATQVLDATAGLGQDACVLAVLGYHVHLLEKNKVIAALLQDGIERLQAVKPDIAARLQLTYIDALDFLNRTPPTANQPQPQAHNLALMQAVYLDPMFPANSFKQALVKKDLRMLRALTGEAPPPAALLEQALAAPYLRVVVKRPIHAAYLNNLAPHHSIKGKTNRFDVYLQPSQAASGIAKT